MTRAKYVENMFYDAVGKGTWSEKKIVNFDCKITYFANDKFRVLHFAPMGEKPNIEFKNDHPEYGGKVFMSDEEKKVINFVRADYF